MNACLATSIASTMLIDDDITTGVRNNRKQQGVGGCPVDSCVHVCMHVHGVPMYDQRPAWIWHGCRLGLHLTTLMLAC